MLTLKNIIIGLLLFLAIGLSAWSIYLSTNKKPFVIADPSKPDAFMENVSAILINKQGLPYLKIKSPKMIHYKHNDTTDIDTPRITVYRQSPEPWYVDSDYAKATQGIEKIFFWKNVIIRHSNDLKAPTTTMQTDSLTVYPSKQIAETTDAVLVLQPNTTIQAIGMFANLKDGTVKLLANARGEYVPKN